VSAKDEDLLTVPTPEDVARMNALWRAIKGEAIDIEFSASNRMDIWIIEHRLRAERLATERLNNTTRALVWATAVLALATIALVVVTLIAAK
jgi:hypothetical protein